MKCMIVLCTYNEYRIILNINFNKNIFILKRNINLSYWEFSFIMYEALLKVI